MTPISLGRARVDRAVLPLCHNGIGLGTPVLTADGELPVEYLTPGDRIVTWDRGLVRLARIETRLVAAAAALRVRPAVLDPDGNGGDGRVFIVADRQQMLVRDWRARILWGKPAALIEAARMIDGAHIARLSSRAPVRLFQLGFADSQHLVQVAGGRFLLASARMPATAKG